MRSPLWALAVAAVGLGGCYGQQVLRQPITVEDTARDNEAIRQQQALLEKRIATLEKLVEDQATLIRSIKAEQASRFDDLNGRLLAIDSQLHDALGSHTGYSPGARYWGGAPPQSGAPSNPGAPVAGGAVAPGAGGAFVPGERGNPVPGAGMQTSGTTSAPMPGSAAIPGSETGPAAGASGQFMNPGDASGGDSTGSGPGSADTTANAAMAAADARKLYDQAYLDYQRGNYSLAVLGFREYLRRNPSTDLSDNAQFWIGECFYAQRDFTSAVQEFQKVVDQYPRGNKVPAALLKIGYSYLQLGDKASARRYLKAVIDQYPNADEADTARNKLRSAGLE